MIRYSSEITIDRPQQVVFDALLDPALYSQWTEMVDKTFDDPGVPTVGSRGRFRLAAGPIKGMLHMEVAELEADRRIVIRIRHPDLAWTAVSTLERVGSGTRLTYAGEVAFRGWRRLLEPFAAGAIRGGEAQEVRRLKALLEGDQASASG